MKKILSSLLLSVFLFSPVVSSSAFALTGSGSTLEITPNSGTVSVTQLSSSTLTEGSMVEILGQNFGSLPPSNGQVCFTPQLCTTPTSFSQIVRSWSSNRIVVQVPDWTLPATGKISFMVLQGGQTTWVSTPPYSFTSNVPVVKTVTPLTIIPGETVITISGSGFGMGYTPGKDKLCIDQRCFLDDVVITSLRSWTDQQIMFVLPYRESGTARLQLYIERFSYDFSGQSVYTPLDLGTFTISAPSGPTITEMSPTTLTPGNTIITLRGKGFGSAYIPGSHQICFSDSCILGTDIASHLLSWTDTEIRVQAPQFLSDMSSSGTLTLRLLHPGTRTYSFFSAPYTYTIMQGPVVTRYYPSMETGGAYSVVGKHFGFLPGKIFIGEQELLATSWSDEVVTFFVPKETTTGDFSLVDATGVPSAPLPVTIVSVPFFSRDPYSRYQWYLEPLRVERAWKQTEGSSDIIVAVIDSAVDFSHEDLQEAAWENPREVAGNNKDDDGNGYVDDIHGWDFVQNTPLLVPQNPHGTLVAGIIAAKKDNALGISGVAPNTRIMSLSVAKKGIEGAEEIDIQAAEKAIQYAVDEGAHIINLSFGGDAPRELYKDALAYAYAHNVLVIAASGNLGKEISLGTFSPACDKGTKNSLLTVSALDQNLARTSFSNYGKSCLDIGAPGIEMISTIPLYYSTNGIPYSYAEGTSFAAPLVSGTAALLLSLHPDWNVEELKSALLSQTFVPSSWSSASGKGVLRTDLALESSRPTVNYAPKEMKEFTLSAPRETLSTKTPPIAPVLPEVEELLPNTPPTTVVPTTPPFSDITLSHKRVEAIHFLKERKIIKGYADGSFRPNAEINRAEFLKILLEARGATLPSDYRNCFRDVTTEWFAPYVCFAKAQQIIEGYPETGRPSTEWEFRPAQTVTKVEAIKMILASFSVPLTSKDIPYTDVDKKAWYAPYVATAYTLGLLEEGERQVFFPQSASTRGTVSEMVYRLLFLREQKQERFIQP